MSLSLSPLPVPWRARCRTQHSDDTITLPVYEKRNRAPPRRHRSSMRSRPSVVAGVASGLVPACSVIGSGGLLIASVLHRKSVDSIKYKPRCPGSAGLRRTAGMPPMATPVQRQRRHSPKHAGVHYQDPAPRHTRSQTGATRPACLAESADAGSLRVPIGNRSRRERGGCFHAVAGGRRSQGLPRDPDVLTRDLN